MSSSCVKLDLTLDTQLSIGILILSLHKLFTMRHKSMIFQPQMILENLRVAEALIAIFSVKKLNMILIPSFIVPTTTALDAVEGVAAEPVFCDV